MQYKKMKCDNCQNEFVWSSEEQKLYEQRGLEPPKYCAICRGMIEAKSRDKARQNYEA